MIVFSIAMVVASLFLGIQATKPKPYKGQYL